CAGLAAFGRVIISKSSLRNGVTGRPSLLNKLQTGLSAQAYLTAAGAATWSLEISTLSLPWTTPLAQCQTLSAPHTANPVTCSWSNARRLLPKQSNVITTLEPATSMVLNSGLRYGKVIP